MYGFKIHLKGQMIANNTHNKLINVVFRWNCCQTFTMKIYPKSFIGNKVKRVDKKVELINKHEKAFAL
jgi:hypothetical protein